MNLKLIFTIEVNTYLVNIELRETIVSLSVGKFDSFKNLNKCIVLIFDGFTIKFIIFFNSVDDLVNLIAE